MVHSTPGLHSRRNSLYADKDARIKDLVVRKHDGKKRSVRTGPGEGHKPESRGLDFERYVFQLQFVICQGPQCAGLDALSVAPESGRLGKVGTEEAHPRRFSGVAFT